MTFSWKKILKRSYPARFVAWLLFFNFFDLLVILLPHRKAKKERKRVIFLKLDGIGDYVVWTASFKTIEAMYPSSQYERILVATDVTRELSENEATFDRKVYLKWYRFIFHPLYRFRTMRQIRRLDGDVLINPRLTREFLWSDSVARCSGAAVRIASHGLDNHMSALSERVSQRWYTRLIAAPLRTDHEMLSHRKFLTAINPDIAPELTAPTIAECDETDTINVEGDYAIFFLGASHPERLWPLKNFAAVADFASKKYGLDIVVAGGPGEEWLVDKFRSEFSGHFTDLVGKTRLLELFKIMKAAKLILSNDTGAGHFAAISKTPAVVITPGNQVGRFFPYPDIPEAEGIRQLSALHEMPCFGCGWHCIYKDLDPLSPKPCIEGVAVNDVISAVSKLLD